MSAAAVGVGDVVMVSDRYGEAAYVGVVLVEQEFDEFGRPCARVLVLWDPLMMRDAYTRLGAEEQVLLSRCWPSLVVGWRYADDVGARGFESTPTSSGRVG